MRNSGRLRLLACTVLLSAAATLGAADAPAAKRFSLDDLAKIVRLSSPQISPDGTSIALIVTRADVEKNKWIPELDLVDVSTGARRVLTRDRKGVAHPRWSPSGDRLAFLALEGADKDAKPQIFVLPMAGGEAQKVTGAPTGVQHFAWRPDGKALAYAAEDERPDKAEIEKGNDLFEVGNDNLFVTEAAMPVHVWLVPVDGGETKRLTSGSWSLPEALPPNSPSSPLSWSPDGKLLAFVRVETPHSGDSDQSTVRILDVESGAIRAVTGKTGFEGYPVFSPDGRTLSYWCPRDRDPNNVNDIYVTNVTTGGEGKNLTQPIDRCLYASVWTPDGKALLVGGNDGTRVSLWLAAVDGPAKRLELGDVNPAWSFFVDATVGKNGSIAFVGSEPGRPPELWFLDFPAAAPKRLTDLNGEIAGRDPERSRPSRGRDPMAGRRTVLSSFRPASRRVRRCPSSSTSTAALRPPRRAPSPPRPSSSPRRDGPSSRRTTAEATISGMPTSARSSTTPGKARGATSLPASTRW